MCHSSTGECLHYLHWNRNVYRCHITSQRGCRFWPVPPFPPLLCPSSTPLFINGCFCLSWRSLDVIELVSHLSLGLACGLCWGGWGSAGGDGGVWCWAVLLSMFEPERVTPGWWGGRCLCRFRHGALWGVLGQLGKRHVVQLRGDLRSLKCIHIKDGLPLFGSFIDGELSKLRNRGSCYDFRPRSSTGLWLQALHVIDGILRWAAVWEHRVKGIMRVELLSHIAEVRVGLWGTVGRGKGTGVYRAVGERFVMAVHTVATAVQRVAFIPPVTAAGVCLCGTIVLGAGVPGVPAVPGVDLTGLQTGELFRVSYTFV